MLEASERATGNGRVDVLFADLDISLPLVQRLRHPRQPARGAQLRSPVVPPE
jgi:hypothetical protein